MTVRLEAYSNDRIPAVRAFNARIAKVVSYAIGTAPTDGGDPRAAGVPLFTETLLAVEGGDVRGGVMLQHQPFVVGGSTVATVNLQLPISEGLVDRAYAYLGMWLVKSVVRRHPHAFAVGMGGLDQPLPKLLKALGWDVREVPFFFHVHHPSRFLLQMPQLKRPAARRMAAVVAAGSGAGWILLRAAQLRVSRAARREPLVSERIASWGPWADTIWENARDTCSMIGVRTADVLRLLYPLTNERHHCVRLRAGARDIGWLALLVTRMQGSDKFGDLVVGTLLDGLTVPGFEATAARAARRLFGTLGVDLSLANHAHITWQRALRDAGYLPARSNYVLAMSKALASAVAGAVDGHQRVHITRGDGDGRIHL